MGDTSSLLKVIPNAPAFSPSLVGTVVLGLLLLFFRDFDGPLRQYLVPSLVVYVLGAGLISFIHTMLWLRTVGRARQEAKPNAETVPLNRLPFWLMIAFQIVWFFFFIGYNFYRAAL
jgi:hypothetical protein